MLYNALSAAGGAYSAPPDPLAVEGEGRGGEERGREGRGADSVSCPRAHMTLATPLRLKVYIQDSTKWNAHSSIGSTTSFLVV